MSNDQPTGGPREGRASDDTSTLPRIDDAPDIGSWFDDEPPSSVTAQLPPIGDDEPAEPAPQPPPQKKARRLIGAFGSARAARNNAAPAGDDDGPKTMTTRVTIRIPGSRPIPPVVLHGQQPLAPGQFEGEEPPPGHDPAQPYAAYATEPASDGHDDGGDEDAYDYRALAPRPSWFRLPRGRRLGILLGIAGLALAGGVYGTSLAYAGGGVPRGVSVLGVTIGGQSRADAERTLERTLAPRALKPIEVKVGDKLMELDPATSGLLVDVQGTVDQVASRSFDPMDTMPAMFGARRDVQPQIVFDPIKLAAVLEQMATDADVQPKDGGITFTGGTPTAKMPQATPVLDVRESTSQVRQAFLANGPQPLVLPMKTAVPHVTQAEVERAMREFAVPAMSGPVTLNAGGKSLKLTPATLAKYLTMVPDATGHLMPRIDAAGLQQEIAGTFSAPGDRPQDATFTVTDGKVTVVPSRTGHGVSGAAAAEAVIGVLTKQGAARTATAQVGVIQPGFSTDQANNLGINSVVGSYTTTFPASAARSANVRRAAELITGHVVNYGDMWSLNDTLGDRTADNGFTKGTVLDGTGHATESFDPGISEVATTMYNAMFDAGMKDVQRTPHPVFTGHDPVGRDALANWPDDDMKWANDSGRAVYIEASATDTGFTVTLYGVKTYDDVKTVVSRRMDVVPGTAVRDSSATCVPQAATDGFREEITRIFFKGGHEVRRDETVTVYAPGDAVTCTNAASAGDGYVD